MLNRVSLLCHIIQWLWITFDRWQTWSSLITQCFMFSYRQNTNTTFCKDTIDPFYLKMTERTGQSAGSMSKLTYLLWDSAAATDTVNVVTGGCAALPVSWLCIHTCAGLFAIRHRPPLGSEGPPCPSAETSSSLRRADIMAPSDTHTLKCYLEASSMVGFASRGPKSEIICVIHIVPCDTNDLIIHMWSELTSVVWMGHSSISQVCATDHRCVSLCMWEALIHY